MLKIHFLNVGHGDCTLVEFPSGRRMMVDINNSKSIDDTTAEELGAGTNFSLMKSIYKNLSVSKSNYELLLESRVNFVEPIDPISYIKEKFGSASWFRFVLTHPDMDHMSGLKRLEQEKIEIVNFWDTENTKEVKETDVKAEYDYRDWLRYQDLRSGVDVVKVLNLYKDAEGEYYTEDGIKILSPTPEILKEANEKSKWNLLSQVLLIEYAGHKVVLGGDADSEVWDELYDTESGVLSGVSLLKAAHHGRDSGYSQKAVKEMNPIWTICSVGKKPSTDASNKYRQYTQKKVLSTRFRGNIVAEIHSDGTLNMYSEHNPEPEIGLYQL